LAISYWLLAGGIFRCFDQ